MTSGRLYDRLHNRFFSLLELVVKLIARCTLLLFSFVFGLYDSYPALPFFLNGEVTVIGA